MPTPAEDADRLLAALRSQPQRSAVMTDVDGTLAPIATSADEAVVPAEAREALVALAARFGLVACVSGRRAADARALVGTDAVTFVGNHGLERLEASAAEPRALAALDGHERDAAEFVAGLDQPRLAQAGLRIEDKGAIQALHWRGADDEQAAGALAAGIGSDADGAGLAIHRGRKVLELRPPVAFDKGAAIVDLLAEHGGIRHALYAGDDRTDLDAFESLRELVASGGLETAVCVGIASDESPYDVTAKADLVVPGPADLIALLLGLARGEG